MTTVRGWGRRRRRMAVAVRSTTVEMSATSEGEEERARGARRRGGIAGLIGGGVSTQRDEGEGV